MGDAGEGPWSEGARRPGQHLPRPLRCRRAGRAWRLRLRAQSAVRPRAQLVPPRLDSHPPSSLTPSLLPPPSSRLRLGAGGASAVSPCPAPSPPSLVLPAPSPACSVPVLPNAVSLQSPALCTVLHRQLLTPSDGNFSSRPDREQELSEGRQVLGPPGRMWGAGVLGPRGTASQRVQGFQSLREAFLSLSPFCHILNVVSVA